MDYTLQEVAASVIFSCHATAYLLFETITGFAAKPLHIDPTLVVGNCIVMCVAAVCSQKPALQKPMKVYHMQGSKHLC